MQSGESRALLFDKSSVKRKRSRKIINRHMIERIKLSPHKLCECKNIFLILKIFFSEMLVNHLLIKFLYFVFIYWRRILFQETSSEINRRLPYALINASDKVNSTFDRLEKIFLVFTQKFSVTNKMACRLWDNIDRRCFFIFKEEILPEECFSNFKRRLGQ